MRPLADLPADVLRALRGVFTDIDDTLTTHGRLTAVAYRAMERLNEAGLAVIPITGRPAGWCDHIARMWPVDAVVGENGAFYFRYDRDRRLMRRRFVDDSATREARRGRLAEIAAEIIRAVPGCAVAADQAYRESDLAIDFCEDVQRVDQAGIDRIVRLMESNGLNAKVSSIHVNGWFGTYDKLTTTRLLMSECFDVDLQAAQDRYLFVGDSPNDCPMFAYFAHSVGVANIHEFDGRLAHEPSYVSRQRGGAGFAEVADCILSARG